MRLRLAVLASGLTAFGAVTLPGIVSAAPSHKSLTINAAPDPVLAGDGVLIYGQLNTPSPAGQKITLYRHIVGSHHGYTAAGSTTTDTHGFYQFKRAENVVFTNRSWFVREASDPSVRSRVFHEHVSALVTLNVAPGPQDTSHKVLFFGHVTPNHAFDRVYLQEQVGSSDEWHTLKSGVLGANSDYAISYRWPRPGDRDVRVLFRSDARNFRGESDPVTVTIEQAQRPGFTIASASPIIAEGQQVTISGVLDKPGTNQPEANTLVTLYAWTHSHRHFTAVGDTTTGADGSYHFTEAPTENTIYVVRTTLAPHRRTAPLYQGVRDIVTMTASAGTAATGSVVTFTGTVVPDKTGRVIYLQRLGDDGEWHTVEKSFVESGSTFHFAWFLSNPGAETFRARITSDRHNVGGHSAPVTVTAS